MNQTKSESDKQTGEIIRYTTCSEHCFSKCVLKVHIGNGKIWAVEPEYREPRHRAGRRTPFRRADRQMHDCGRPCTKGYAHIRNLNAPNRVIYPMKRAGEKGEGKWQRISWDEALDTIAGKLKYYKEKYGPLFNRRFGHDGFVLVPGLGQGLPTGVFIPSRALTKPERWVLGRNGRGRPAG